MATDTDTANAAQAGAEHDRGREELHTSDLVPDDRPTKDDEMGDDAADRTDDVRAAGRSRTDDDSQDENTVAMQAREPESAARRATDEVPMALFDNASDLEARWQEIQVKFVDEPRGAVEEADALVAEVMRRLAETFASERDQMEKEWHAGDQVSTEDLRIALKRYRSFFQRLLAA